MWCSDVGDQAAELDVLESEGDICKNEFGRHL